MKIGRHELLKAIRQTSLLLSFLIFFCASASAEADGKKLFKTWCAQCHKIDKRFTGPALRGAMDRVPSKEWLFRWVKNSQKLVKEGDPYAVKIFAEYNKTIMTPNAVSDEEILAIMDYVESDVPPPPQQLEEQGEAETDLTWILIVIIVLVILIWILRSVSKSLRNIVNEREGKSLVKAIPVAERLATWVVTHKRHTAFIILLLVGIGSVKGWYALKGIGVYQGYAPEQPIKFSHKIHAGDNGIECVYCHHGAEKGKTAGIPSVNICMNCHRGIDEGSLWGNEEISKIHDAAGWNPASQQYDRPQKPIRWIRIHNLPDFAYFNHSQHVVVGKQQCQTCHGPVEEIDYPMYQHSELTMGWCVECHRTTNVDMEGNEYYAKLHEQLKEKYKEKGIEQFTVNDIGGLECAKCHY